jgi:hypothetical protein
MIPKRKLKRVKQPRNPQLSKNLKSPARAKSAASSKTERAKTCLLILSSHCTDLTTAWIPASGPQEIITLEGNVNPDGNYSFDDIELLERQIYVAELDLDGLSYRSEFAVVSAGAAELTLPTIVVHATTENFNALQIDSMQIFFDLASEETAQIFAVYTISNTSDKTILVKMGDGQNVPFLAFPEGSSGLGYEATQDSAAFVPTGKVSPCRPATRRMV